MNVLGKPVIVSAQNITSFDAPSGVRTDKWACSEESEQLSEHIQNNDELLCVTNA